MWFQDLADGMHMVLYDQHTRRKFQGITLCICSVCFLHCRVDDKRNIYTNYLSHLVNIERIYHLLIQPSVLAGAAMLESLAYLCY